MEKALAREMKEELNVKVGKMSLIGMVDNMFKQEGEKHHEINFVFTAKVDKISTQSQEKHIDFALFSREEFIKEKKIYPVALKKQLLKWLKDKKFFWVSQ
jgi:ADP-ribose pyrophosphatase YjhB (NUDIX family)